MTRGKNSNVCVLAQHRISLMGRVFVCWLIRTVLLTHPASLLVCLFTVSLAHSIPNPEAARDGGREINLCTYTRNNNLHFTDRLSCCTPSSSHHAHIFPRSGEFKRHLFQDTTQIPPVAPTTDAIE